MFYYTPASLRRELRKAMKRPDVRARIIGRRPAIYDPLGAKVTRRTLIGGSVVRATRRVR